MSRYIAVTWQLGSAPARSLIVDTADSYRRVVAEASTWGQASKIADALNAQAEVDDDRDAFAACVIAREARDGADGGDRAEPDGPEAATARRAANPGRPAATGRGAYAVGDDLGLTRIPAPTAGFMADIEALMTAEPSGCECCDEPTPCPHVSEPF